MQVIPATWDYVETVLVGRRIPRTTSGNVQVGFAFLRQLLREFRGDGRLALAAYVQGPRSVRRHGLFRQTRRYVAGVLALSTGCSSAPGTHRACDAHADGQRAEPALLARQMLLERVHAPIPRVLERMGGLQAQYAPSMYIGLWSRVEGLERDAVTGPFSAGASSRAR